MAKELSDVFAANKDFERRISNLSIDVIYDTEFDILMLRFGESREAITEELYDGLQLRVDPETLEILAFEVLGFRRRFLRRHPEYIRLCDLLFGDDEIIRRRFKPDTGARKKAEDAVDSLLPFSLGGLTPRPAG